MERKKVHYLRVSTFEQSLLRQQDAIKESITIDAKRYEDKCSGSVLFKDRDIGKELIREIEAGEIGEVHIHSIDRLGRNTIDILNTIQLMTSNGVNVISKKEGLRTLNEDGTENMTAKLMVGILGTLAEFERSRLKERQREGIDSKLLRGSFHDNEKAGRDTETKEQFLNKAISKKVLRELKNGESVRRTSGLCKCSVSTVQKVLRLYGRENL